MAIAHRTGSPYTVYPGYSITGIAVTTGDLILVMHSYGYTFTSTAPTDNSSGGSNTYTEAGSIRQDPSGALAQPVSLYVWKAVAKGTETLTITCNIQDDDGMSVHVYNPNGAAISQDGAATTLADLTASTTQAGPNIDVSSGLADAVVVAFAAQEDTAANSSAWTNSFIERTDVTAHVHHSADRFVTAAGTYSTGFTSSTSEGYVWVMVVFKTPAAAGGTVIPVFMHHYQHTMGRR